MPSSSSLDRSLDLLQRIACILTERYEPFAAERVALRIVECIRPGDRLGSNLVATFASYEARRPSTEPPQEPSRE